ncbi:MAG TPA: hypothetical protein VF615_01230 [Longimicrobiaceae bacterium]|jgi:hypothetical protein
MEPISTTVIVSALAAGAAAAARDTAAAAVKDAYTGLKAVIQRKYAGVDVTLVEKKPDSVSKRDSIAEDLAEAGAEGDTELQELARVLVAALEREAPQVAPAIGVDLEKVKAAFLRVGLVESAGTGIKVRESEFDAGIDIGSVKAGNPGDRVNP